MTFFDLVSWMVQHPFKTAIAVSVLKGVAECIFLESRQQPVITVSVTKDEEKSNSTKTEKK